LNHLGELLGVIVRQHPLQCLDELTDQPVFVDSGLVGVHDADASAPEAVLVERCLVGLEQCLGVLSLRSFGHDASFPSVLVTPV
jgi:hypothetical protein